MIDREHGLPLAGQAQELGISRGSIYCLARAMPEADLAIMRRVDELHLLYPFASSWEAARFASAGGYLSRPTACRDAEMGLEALYRPPNTSEPAPGTRSIRTCCASWR